MGRIRNSSTLLHDVVIGATVMCILTTNGFVFITLIRGRKFRSLPCFALLTSLSLTDMMAGMVLGLYWIAYLYTSSLTTCRIILSFSSAVVLASFNHAIAIAIDRLNAAVRPFGYHRKRNVSVSLAVIGTIWTISFALSFLLHYVYTDGDIVLVDHCNPGNLWGQNERRASIYAIVYVVSAYVIVCTCYLIILRKIRSKKPHTPPGSRRPSNVLQRAHEIILAVQNHRRREVGEYVPESFPKPDEVGALEHVAKETDAPGDSIFDAMNFKLERMVTPRSLKASSKKNRINKMAFLLIALLLVCYLPVTFIYTLRAMDYHGLATGESWAYIPIVANSAVNPFMYASRLPGFKSAFLKMFSPRCSRPAPV